MTTEAIEMKGADWRERRDALRSAMNDGYTYGRHLATDDGDMGAADTMAATELRFVLDNVPISDEDEALREWSEEHAADVVRRMQDDEVAAYVGAVARAFREHA